MTPARFNECLEWLHRDTDVLAGVLGCDQMLTETYALGLPLCVSTLRRGPDFLRQREPNHGQNDRAPTARPP